MTALLKANHLMKFYGSHQAVNDVSLALEPGALTAVIGPNGAGKSTTISMLIGVAEPDGGTISYPAYETRHNHAVQTNRHNRSDQQPEQFSNGSGSLNSLSEPSKMNPSSNRVDPAEPIHSARLRAKRPTIGVVFQNSVLDPQLTARENLMMRTKLYRSIHGPKARVAELIDLVQLGPFADQRYGSLSGGQRRSVDIARALINDPDILVLDEPTTGLDITTRDTLWKLLSDLRQHAHLSILLTTHYLEEAEHAEQVYVINHGRVMASGSAEQLIGRYAEYQLSLTLKPDVEHEADATLNRMLNTLGTRDAANSTNDKGSKDESNRQATIASLSADQPAGENTAGRSAQRTQHDTEGRGPTVIAPDATHRTLALPNADQSLALLTALRPYLADFECRPGTMNDVFLALTQNDGATTTRRPDSRR